MAENRDNPLRDWEGHEQISRARYTKAVAQYRATRSAVEAALSDGAAADVLVGIGRTYAEAFNALDGTRNPFIETAERDDLFDALHAAVDHAEASLGRTFPDARAQLLAGMDDARDW